MIENATSKELRLLSNIVVPLLWASSSITSNHRNIIRRHQVPRHGPNVGFLDTHRHETYLWSVESLNLKALCSSAEPGTVIAAALLEMRLLIPPAPEPQIRRTTILMVKTLTRTVFTTAVHRHSNTGSRKRRESTILVPVGGFVGVVPRYQNSWSLQYRHPGSTLS